MAETAASVMTVLDRPPGVNLAAPVARANPLTKLAAALLISCGLVLSLDVVSAGVALALEMLVLPWCGLAPAALWRRGWVVLVAAIPAGIATTLFGRHSGEVLLELGPVTATTASLASGVAVTLRLIAIALPGVVLLATTDPTELAAALSQRLRLPARFVLAALAALRLAGVISQEWNDLTMARRARGVGGGGPVERVREAFARVFALLVLALRRGTVLATTMESRGFGSTRERTWARRPGFSSLDVVVGVGAVGIVVIAVWAAVRAGTWHPLYR